MGLAGWMLIGAIVSLFAMLKSAGSLLKWLKVGKPVMGVIGNPIHLSKDAPMDKPANRFEMTAELDGRTYRLQHHVERACIIEPGTQIKIRLNPQNGDHVVWKDVIGKPLGFAAAFGVCVVVLIGCFFLLDSVK